MLNLAQNRADMGEVHRQALQTYNTFGVAAQAIHFATFTNVVELQSLLRHANEKKWPVFPLGGGSNILLTRDVEGLTIHNQIKGIQKIKEDDKYVWVKAGAGESWHGLVEWCLARNLAGIENLSLIPGFVGAAPMQNIGAYGVELKDVFYTLEAIRIADGTLQTFGAAECAFGYRESIFKQALKGEYIITSVTLQLHKKPTFHTTYGAILATIEELGIDQLSIQAISRAVIHIRQSKLPDPKKLGNAGSFFKNPVVSAEKYKTLAKLYPDLPHYTLPGGEEKIPAAWLIEQCGWKGKKIGRTGAHARQPLVLVNYGGATGNEIWALAKQIQASVKAKFDILLHPEVNVI